MIDPGWIALIGSVAGALLLGSFERQFNRSNKPKALTPAVSSLVESETGWLVEDWSNPEYVQLIHSTRDKEQAGLGYVISVCLCDFHKAEVERTEFIGLDIEKVNARTRAQKEVTYREYYNSEDDPSRKPVMNLSFNKTYDHRGRATITANEIRAESIQSSFVRDPYSEKMRLKDEIMQMRQHIDGLVRQMEPNDAGHFITSTHTMDRYRASQLRLRRLMEEYKRLDKPPVAGYIDYDEAVAKYRDNYISRSYKRGGEVEKYEVYAGDSNVPVKTIRVYPNQEY